MRLSCCTESTHTPLEKVHRNLCDHCLSSTHDPSSLINRWQRPFVASIGFFFFYCEGSGKGDKRRRAKCKAHMPIYVFVCAALDLQMYDALSISWSLCSDRMKMSGVKGCVSICMTSQACSEKVRKCVFVCRLVQASAWVYD